ncbi:MAG: methionyl-tRNA formyltransferase [Thermoleophilia bacterium]|nr:methionyl-tRNA formyltransferase [Thermoleophilia bacterium]
MRVIFAGSPASAVPVLEALLASRHEVVLVVTREDRPRGRRGTPVPTPIGTVAVEKGIATLTPTSINTPDSLAALRAVDADVIAVAAFGQILGDEVLGGWPCINVHYSLLPAYRGAAPVERALMDCCEEVGITIMQMDAGLDTGPIIEQVPVALTGDDDAGGLLMTMAATAGPALIRALDAVESGTLVVTPQPDEGVTIAAKITRDDRPIDLTRTAAQIAGQVRALSPHVGATIVIDGVPVTVWRVGPVPDTAAPGLVRGDGRLILGTASGALQILEIQPSGTVRMPVDAFLRGYRGELTLST